MFFMNHGDIKKILKAGKKFTYINLEVDHHPQKEDPNRIQLVAGGNLIEGAGKVLVTTANIDTAKLHWNSVVSTALAKYMCINIKSFFLSAALEYYRYMKIPYPVPTMDHQTIQVRQARTQWIYLFGIEACSVGLTSGWYPCNQTPETKIGVVWVPRMQEYARIMVPRNKEHNGHARG